MTTASPLPVGNFTASMIIGDDVPGSIDYPQVGESAAAVQAYPAYQAYNPYAQLSGRRERRELVARPKPDCVEPPSYVADGTVSIWVLYRIVYWTTQLLTWFLIPFLSAYVQAGEFTVLQKTKTALIENAIYYGTYVLIFVILLVYVGISTQYQLSFANLKLIGITAANTWGLFLLGKCLNKWSLNTQNQIA